MLSVAHTETKSYHCWATLVALRTKFKNLTLYKRSKILVKRIWTILLYWVQSCQSSFVYTWWTSMMSSSSMARQNSHQADWSVWVDSSWVWSNCQWVVCTLIIGSNWEFGKNPSDNQEMPHNLLQNGLMRRWKSKIPPQSLVSSQWSWTRSSHMDLLLV